MTDMFYGGSAQNYYSRPQRWGSRSCRFVRVPNCVPVATIAKREIRHEVQILDSRFGKYVARRDYDSGGAGRGEPEPGGWSTYWPGMTEIKQALVERLFVEHDSALRAFVRRWHGSTDAAELAQEVYLRILRLRDTDAIRNPEAYLYRVAINLAHERRVIERRHARAADLDELSPDSLLADLPTLGLQIDTGVRVKRLREVLRQLPSKCQAAVTLRYWHGMSYAEIAGQLGISTQMVKKYLNRALTHCRRRMARLE